MFGFGGMFIAIEHWDTKSMSLLVTWNRNIEQARNDPTSQWVDHHFETIYFIDEHFNLKYWILPSMHFYLCKASVVFGCQHCGENYLVSNQLLCGNSTTLEYCWDVEHFHEYNICVFQAS